ncbi:hypothetical protein NDU88_000550 [Pleurodeles waltl]|uniref:Uncharacterized protein n=1 Tax=Pleurodeles waltl TaxID=8319 RepID=A0AAV7KMA2_PLEWA|nr:hypothetical protein NDU88_000550 [Pleurodeles waltl]
MCMHGPRARSRSAPALLTLARRDVRTVWANKDSTPVTLLAEPWKQARAGGRALRTRPARGRLGRLALNISCTTAAGLGLWHVCGLGAGLCVPSRLISVRHAASVRC